MPKIVIVDTYYQDFLDALRFTHGDYAAALAQLLSLGFGTFDAYSHALSKIGWQCTDIVANYEPLQRLWMQENGRYSRIPQVTVLEQIEAANPDVVFMQDLSFFDAETLRKLSAKYLLAGQCSCPMPRAELVNKFHVLFTSFPHYVERFKALGVRAEYLPLAFDPRMIPPVTERDIDISFVGGVGKNSHWKAGTDVLEAVAERFGERFQWFGYGLENLAPESPLRKCYRGQAWGRKQYEVYGRSKCVVNRHGEVAEGNSNNLRLFEASGCGAVVFTEESGNLRDLFPGVVGAYRDLTELFMLITFDLNNRTIASMAQAHTLKHHNYDLRMAEVSRVLQECRVAA